MSSPSPSTTRVQVCGELRLEVAGRPREAELRGRQGRLVLAYLVLHRERPVRRDELLEALSPRAGAAVAPTTLAPVLSRLRGALAPGGIEGRDPVALVLPGEVLVDLEQARRELARARGAGPPAERLASAQAAAATLAPGLLPGLEAAWLDAPRAAVDELRVEALELVALTGIAVDPSAAEEAARLAVAAAPFRESARAALIEVLRQRGNLAEALRAFEEVRVLLREELGTAPGPALLGLHAQLLSTGSARTAPPPAAPAPRPPAPPDLVEREAELGALDARLDELEAGAGGVLLLEGSAGVGKTLLLQALRRRAAGRGARVHFARASVLERSFGFGVVRQLLEAPLAAAPELLGTAAPAARAVFSDVAEVTELEDRSFAALHGLGHLVLALAEPGPLVLCVDDLQWSDAPSLRFVVYLARRVADRPVLLAATVRTGEPSADDLLLAELGQEPGVLALRPLPLTPAAVAALVTRRLGAPAPEFAMACHEVTAGNPLLLSQLVGALAAEGVTPEGVHAAQVRAVGPRAVSRTVLLRLARLPEPARGVARAVALLGEHAELPSVAALAGMEVPAAAAAAGVLARADILRSEAPLGFVHPLVREAVYDQVPGTERGLEHARAARLLHAGGAAPDLVAAQLLRVAPAGDPWVVERLREAARLSLARGAAESAIALLARAREEPPSDGDVAAVLLELGSAAAVERGAEAAGHLREAHAALRDPRARGEAALRLARMLYFLDDPAEAPRVAAAALAELPASAEFADLRDALEAAELVGVVFGVVDPAELGRLEAVRAAPRSTGPGACALTGLAAFVLAAASGPADEAAALAHEALRDDLLVEDDPVLLAVAPLEALALADPGEGLAAWRRSRARAARTGGALGPIAPAIWGGLTLLWTGRLAEAEEWLETGHEHQRLWGMVMRAEQAFSSAFMAQVRLERGDLDGAVARLALTPGGTDPSDGTRFWLASEAGVLLAAGRPEQTLERTAQIAALSPPDLHPLWSPWRGLAARAHAALGDRPRALVLAEEELELARRTRASWVIGRGLRQLGELGGPGGLEALVEAERLLRTSSARLEHAKAAAALGAAQGDGAGRAAWTRALSGARECGAEALAARAEAALGGAAPTPA